VKVGISSWTYPWAIGVKGFPPKAPLSAAGLLEKARTMGAEVVQIADNLPLDDCSVIQLRKAAAEVTLELGTRGTEPAHLLRYLEYSVSLGSRLLRTLPGETGNEECLREVLPEFERHGVVLALENHERLPAAELAGLVQRLDSPWVGICLDTVNSLGLLEMPEYTIKILAPYTVNVHVKDFEIARVTHMMGFEIMGRPAGRGRLDLQFLLDHVRVHGRDPNLVLEQWPPLCASLEETIANEAAWAEAGFDYLKAHAA
jgi:3-oxoisoapionate decarboxylase